MKCRFFSFCVAVLLLVVVFNNHRIGQTGETSPKRPNILFIMADDHAFQAFSCYGSKLNRTPNLDRLATEGMRFDRCFCTNSICGPSRAVILTGKYSHVNGYLRNVRCVFDGRQPHVAKHLQRAGYQTAIVGKWHLKSAPTGFDYWNILPGQGEYYDPKMIEMGQKKKHKGYVTDIITDMTIDYLEKRRDPNKLFFLMYHHKAPHRNWQPGPKQKTLYNGVTFPEPATFNDDYSHRGTAARDQKMRIEDLNVPRDTKIEPPPGLDKQALKKWKYQRYIQDYLRCIASIDENVGRVLDYLDQSGLAQNTIVVYTSDQGFYLGEHGWFDKRFMYEYSLRMPLLIRWPGHIPPGSVNRDLVLNLDFAETFLDCAGMDIPNDMQGRSLLPLLEGPTPSGWRTSMYYRYYEFPRPHHVYPHYGVRTARYKLIFYPTLKEWELFDLEKDPEELRSVYANPAYADTLNELKAELTRLRKLYQDDDSVSDCRLPKNSRRSK